MQKNADLANAKVLRGDQVIPVDLHALYVENDRSQNVALQPGDTVVIPENEQGYVFVLGLVNRPGPVNHFKGLRLSQALAEAGGQVLDGNIREIRIVRGAGQARKTFRVDFRAFFNPPNAGKEKEMRTAPPSGGRLVRIPEEPEVKNERSTRKEEDDARVEDISGDPVLERGDVILVLEDSSAKSRRTLLPWLSTVGNLLSYYIGRGLLQ
jgi:protein involved in polysaccharide export with SLBB domain